MSRLPIRLRLTVAFATAMAVVLLVTGVFLHVRLAASLDEGIDETLELRAAELEPSLLRESGRPSPAGGEQDERFVQLLDENGSVVTGTSGLAAPLLDRARLDDVAKGRRWFVRGEVEGVAGRARLLATPLAGGSGVLVVGASLEDRDEALRELLALLLLVGPAALLLSSGLGYALAAAALRPVESMRAEASALSGIEPERRLTLPHSNDEIRRLGETLNEMLDRLHAALERERAFVADASHELRTPLALLKTELDLALRRSRSPAELESALRSAAAETDRLAQLADDLLLLARSDRGELPLRKASIAAEELLERTARRFSQRAEAEGRRLEVRAAADLTLAGDELRLEQALANLVENSLRHGGGSVLLSASARDGRVELKVSDEGAGFPVSFLPRAFERFSRGEDARSGEGAGLGLTIVDLVARAHGGSAAAANREGGGAAVWLSLPQG